MSAIAFRAGQEVPRKCPENQLRRFVLIGLGTVTVDYALFYVLVYRTHISYLLAAAVSFIVSSVCNYWSSVGWVFIPGKYRMGLEATLFFLTGLIGLLCESGLHVDSGQPAAFPIPPG